MKFKDLNLELNNKLLWKTEQFDYWIGEVTEISKSYLFVTWVHISDGEEQTVKYRLDAPVFNQITCDEMKFVEYLDLFKQKRVLW